MFAKVKPLALSMGTYSFMYALSDMTQQKLVTKKHEVDIRKTAMVSSVGGLAIAPLVFTWIRLVEFLIPGRAVLAVAKKVVAEQVFFAPVVINTFYIATSFLERKKDIFAESRAKFIPTYKAGLMFWPVIQTINFGFVPMEKKVYLIAVSSFVWSNFLCYMKEKET